MDAEHRLALSLRRLRQERSLSQEAFGDEAGVHRTYISDLERAARNPSIGIVETLATALGISASDLIL